jgi:hypothetical protein
MPSLLLLNGSPRGAKSNSLRMLAQVAEGWREAGGAAPEVLHLAQPADFQRALAAFREAGTVLLGMPLYTDSMPALVLRWIEALASQAGQPGPRPTLAFLVQSGFPEATHCRPLERYLEKLARRLGCPCAGTIVRGAGESLRSRPDRACRGLFGKLRRLGGELARDGRFGADSLRAVAGIERLGPVTLRLVGLLAHTPLARLMWDRDLKANRAWERRFAAPYGPAAAR